MEAQQLSQLDSSFKLVEQQATNYVFGICHPYLPKEGHFFLAKTIKFYQEIEKSITENKIKDSGLIVEAKILSQIDCEKNLFSWIATVDNIDLALSSFSQYFYQQKYRDLNEEVDGRQLGSVDIDPTARIAQNVFIAEHVKIGKNVKILPGCAVMNGSEIADGTIIYPNVTIYKDVKIGANCRVHSGAVIGSDGFGYNFNNGIHHKVWHLYGVEIGDEVEIGANTTIDSGVLFPTQIGSGSKIDNLVQIAHNCILGKGVILCGQAGLGGSAKAGHYTVMGGRAMLGPGVSVGNQVMIAGAAGVSHDWGDQVSLAGMPAQEHRQWLREQAQLRKLLKKNKADS